MLKAGKYLEVVKKNANWEYPLDVPDEDELSLGHDDGEYGEVVNIMNHMKVLTTKMRRGEPLSIPGSVDPGGTPQYYQELLPHYKEFADALIEYRHTIDFMDEKTFSLSLGYAALPREVLNILQNALQRTHFHNLQFYSNEIHGVGYINFIANCVTANARLKCLHLGAVTFENTTDVDLLCAAVNNHDSLSRLSLHHCEKDQDQRGLPEMFNKLKSQTLEEIDLLGNGISNLNPGDMSDFLSSNPSLRKLNLVLNPFNEQDIVYISDALRNNTSLRELKFSILSDSWHLLATIVFNQTSLNSAYDSNHHCHLQLSRQTYPSSKFNLYEDPIMNRRKKIYHILSTRNRNRENAAYFESDNIGIKHMPQILALLKPFSEHYLGNYDDKEDDEVDSEDGKEDDEVDSKDDKEDDEVEPLSIAYEILRDWKMPELYNYLDVMEED